MSRPRTPFRTVVIAAILLGILILTLAPVGNKPPLPFSFDVAVGRRWLADGILNLWLFVPLGLAVGWKARPLAAPVLFGFLLSIFIELAQIMVPGRDPGLGDIVFNTLGAAVGALIARRLVGWLDPDEKTSVVLAAASTVVAAAIMIATVLLLSPAGGKELMSIDRHGDELVIRYQSRASTLGLDQPEYWVSATTPDSSITGPTVGQGWALLAYPDDIGRRRSAVVNAIWMVALCLPIGFWARGKLRPIPVAVLMVLMVLVPKLTGTAATSGLEWLGAVVGVIAGACLAAFVNRVLRFRREGGLLNP